MGIRSQTDTIAIISLMVTDTITRRSTTVLLVVMMGMFMRILDCHTTAIHTHIILTQVLIIITTTTHIHTPTQTLLHTMQVVLEG